MCLQEDDDDEESEFEPGSDDAIESEDISHAAGSEDEEADANDRAASRRRGELS